MSSTKYALEPVLKMGEDGKIDKSEFSHTGSSYFNDSGRANKSHTTVFGQAQHLTKVEHKQQPISLAYSQSLPTKGSSDKREERLASSGEKKKKKNFFEKVKSLGSSAMGKSSSNISKSESTELDDLKNRSISNNGIDFSSLSDGSKVGKDESVLVERKSRK